MKLILFILLSAGLAWAGGQSDKPDLSGTWHLQSSGDDAKNTWVIKHRDDNISLRELDTSGKTRTEISCGTRGVECPVKINGDAAKVTYYFNGPALVELVWKGKQVTKTRRTLSPDGSTMTVEVMQMTPPGDPEKHVLVRAAEPTQSAAR